MFCQAVRPLSTQGVVLYLAGSDHYDCPMLWVNEDKKYFYYLYLFIWHTGSRVLIMHHGHMCLHHMAFLGAQELNIYHVMQFKGQTMSFAFKWFNICLAGLMAVLAVASSIAAIRYIVVSASIP